MSSIRLNMHEAKTHLSQYLNEMNEGDRLILCKRNRPVAEVRLLPQGSNEPRPIGVAKGEFRVPNAFFESLPETLLDAFEGRA